MHSQQQRDEAEQQSISEDRHAAVVGAASASASAPALLARAYSSAQLYHTDGLHCIFAFLPLRSLPAVAAVCKHWLAAAAKEPSRALSILYAPFLLPLLIHSSLRHHVQSLDLLQSCGMDTLGQLQRLPSLTRLRICVDGDELLQIAVAAGGGRHAVTVISRMFPRDLTSIKLRVTDSAQSAQAQQLLIKIVARVMKLSILKLDFSQQIASDLQLSPLQRSTQLASLTLTGSGWRLRESHAQQLASLSSLTELNVNSGSGWTAPLLNVLTDPAHCMLQQLHCLQMLACRCVSAAHVQALARLPALCKLKTWILVPDALPQLSSLSALTDLGVAMAGSDENNLSPAAGILPHLSACTSLTSLIFCHWIFQPADLQMLVTSLPQLQKLGFWRCQVPSLEALSQAVHLHELDVTNTRSFRLADLLPLAACKSLHKLTVDLPADDHAVARFMLSHSDFQHLDSFEITR